MTATTRRADDARQLALGAALLGDCRTRAAGRDGEPLEEPGEGVGGTDPDHLLARVDLVAATGREAGRRRDRVGE